MQTLTDLAIIAMLALVSLAGGYTLNRFSAQPLPIVYQNPEQRFDKELTTLVTAAPFAVTPAATTTLRDSAPRWKTKAL